MRSKHEGGDDALKRQITRGGGVPIQEGALRREISSENARDQPNSGGKPVDEEKIAERKSFLQTSNENGRNEQRFRKLKAKIWLNPTCKGTKNRVVICQNCKWGTAQMK